MHSPCPLFPGELGDLHSAIAAEPEDFTLRWSFEGTKHFIGHDDRLAEPRSWLLGLITALEEDDRDTILAGLEAVQSDLAARVE